MAERPPTQIGLLAPSKAARAKLHQTISALDFGSIIVESEDYPTSAADLSLTLWRQAAPNVIFVVSSDAEEIVSTVSTLHQVLPWSWLLVISEVRDTQVVLQAIRAGAREFLQPPISMESLREAVDRFYAENERDVRTKAFGKVYGVFAAKGGLGATTIAVNLAVAISTLPSTRIAVLDLDYPLGDAAALLDVRPPYTVFDAFDVSSRLDAVLLESYAAQKDGIALLAAPAEVEAKRLPTLETFRKTLEVVAESYTHSMVDLPGHMDLQYLEQFARLCDRLLVVVTPELLALWRAHRLLTFMGRWDLESKIKLVVNKDNRSEDITIRQIEKMLEMKVSWSLPYDYGQATDAVNKGKPIVKGGGSALTERFAAIAQDLTGLAIPQKKAGFLGSLFRKRQNPANQTPLQRELSQKKDGEGETFLTTDPALEV